MLGCTHDGGRKGRSKQAGLFPWYQRTSFQKGASTWAGG